MHIELFMLNNCRHLNHNSKNIHITASYHAIHPNYNNTCLLALITMEFNTKYIANPSLIIKKVHHYKVQH